MYFFAMLHVLLHHNEPLWGGGPLCSTSGACNPVVAGVHDLFYPVAMPSFLLLAGLKDTEPGASPPRLLRQVFVLLSLGSVFFYYVPGLAHRFWRLAFQLEFGHWRADDAPEGRPAVAQRPAVAAKVDARLGSALMHVHTYQWFFFVLAAYKLASLARRTS